MSHLDELLGSTRARLAIMKERITPEVLEQRLPSIEAPRGFARALQGNGVAIVAEIKRATPRGELNPHLNASDIARAYARGGAAAISVLTEPDTFKGSFEDLYAARGAGLPVLRKDFILDELQVLESRAEGADALLLIVRALAQEELARLYSATRSLGMDALVEVHDEAELDRALEVGARTIGVNHRDLATFEVDPDRTAKLAPRMPEGTTLIALSGVRSRAEVEELGAAGAHAVLVGETLVTAEDPEAKLRELLGGP